MSSFPTPATCTDSTAVTINLYPLLRPPNSSSIEWNGAWFDCSQCTYALCCGAATYTPSALQGPCTKCSCEARGNTVCKTGSGANGNSLCTGGCNGLTGDGPVYGTTAVNQTYPCCTALQIIADPAAGAKVNNKAYITNACNPTTRLACCQGVGTAEGCGAFWGPTNTAGDCDSLMEAYCANGAAQPGKHSITPPLRRW